MASTYTLNNGIELIGTGEQSGTWGDTTNTNLELLDTALDGQVTITASSAGSSGSPNSLPITDGSASNGRNRLINITSGSDLGGTVFYQLTPNDAEKIVYIRNSLNAQDLIVFQGTYNSSNDYLIPNGTTAVVFFNGAGSGAVAANVFNNAHFDAMNVVGGVTITTDDNTAQLTLISTDADANAGPVLKLRRNSASPADDDLIGAIDWTSENSSGDEHDFLNLTARMRDVTAGSEDVAYAWTAYLNGTGREVQSFVNTDLSAASMVFNEDSQDIDFRIESDTKPNAFSLNGATGSVGFNVLDGDVTGDATAARQYVSIIGTANRGRLNLGTTASNGADAGTLAFTNGANELVSISVDTTAGVQDKGTLFVNGTRSIKIQAAATDEVVFNESGLDVDFRVESDDNPNMLYVDAANDRIGIGNTGYNTTADLNLLGRGLSFKNDVNGNNNNWSLIQCDITSDQANMKFISGSGNMEMTHGAGLVISPGQNGYPFVFNETSKDCDFRVESDSNSNALLVDASAGGVEMNMDQSNVGLFINNTTHDSIVQIQASASNKNSVIRFADGDDADVGIIDYDHNDNSMDIFTNALTNGISITGTKGLILHECFENFGTSNYDLSLQRGRTFYRAGNIGDDVKIRVFQGSYTYCGGSIEFVIRKDSGTQTSVGSGVIYFNGRESENNHTIVGYNDSSQIVTTADAYSTQGVDGKFTFSIRGTNGDSHISIENRLGSVVNMALRFNILYQG